MPTATIGTVFAYQSVANLLQRGYPRLRNVGFYFSQDFPAGFYGDNLILIGFPKTNRVTSDVFERLQPRLIITVHSMDKPTNNYDGPAREMAELMSRYNGYPPTATIGYLVEWKRASSDQD